MTSSSAWIRPALFFLAVSAAATAIAVVIGASRGSSSTATTQTTVTTVPPATTVVTTATNATTPTTPTTASTPTTTTPAPHPPVSGTWPPGKSGYTVVLESIPLASGRASAAARARAARQAGLPRVGVLDSSGYPSLHPGYFVVFSGVYASSAQAGAAVPTARANGFPDAYQAHVSR
jgi:hypothetical protein